MFSLLQVATTCFPCSPPLAKSRVINLHSPCICNMTTATGCLPILQLINIIMCHVLPTSCSSVIILLYVRIINHEAPHYTFLSSLLLLPSSVPNIFMGTLSQTSSAHFFYIFIPCILFYVYE
jgi:hypothetical protein